ncbi:hypothetical protein D1007_23629 [Hordeum vulgare]|nr:hypothetical protein D1007_23629 [Hordeum vulgare]
MGTRALMGVDLCLGLRCIKPRRSLARVFSARRSSSIRIRALLTPPSCLCPLRHSTEPAPSHHPVLLRHRASTYSHIEQQRFAHQFTARCHMRLASRASWARSSVQRPSR